MRRFPSHRPLFSFYICFLCFFSQKWKKIYLKCSTLYLFFCRSLFSYWTWWKIPPNTSQKTIYLILFLCLFFLPIAETIRFSFHFELIVILCDALHTSTVSGRMNWAVSRVVVTELAGVVVTDPGDAAFPLVTSLAHWHSRENIGQVNFA